MPLTAGRDVQFFASEEFVDLPVNANAVIYKGAFVGRDRATGFARPLIAGDEFLGLALRDANNAFVGNVAGGINVRLNQHVDIVHTLSSVAQGDVGKDVYASDDSTLVLTGLLNSRVGRIVAVDGANLARVRLHPLATLSGVLEPMPITVLNDADATLTLDHVNRVLMISNSAARVVTLPAVASVRPGAWIRLIKTNSAAFAVTLDGNGTETIDGATTFAGVDALNDVVQLMCTGSGWTIVSRDIT